MLLPHQSVYKNVKCLRGGGYHPHRSQTLDKIGMKLSTTSPMFLGQAIQLDQRECFTIKPEVGNPIWRPETGSTHISACRRDRNEIPTAISMFSGSSYQTRSTGMLYFAVACVVLYCIAITHNFAH